MSRRPRTRRGAWRRWRPPAGLEFSDVRTCLGSCIVVCFCGAAEVVQEVGEMPAMPESGWMICAQDTR